MDDLENFEKSTVKTSAFQMLHSLIPLLEHASTNVHQFQSHAQGTHYPITPLLIFLFRINFNN